MAMSSHVTLRGLMGLGDEPAALQDSALIMIDCQNTYRRGEAASVSPEVAEITGRPPTDVMHFARDYAQAFAA